VNLQNLQRYSPTQICKGKLAALRCKTCTLRTRRRPNRGDTAAAPSHISPEPHHEHQHGYSTASPAPAQPILASLVRHASPNTNFGTAACAPTHHTHTRYPHWIPTPNPITTPSHHNSVLSNFSILVFPPSWHHELHFWSFSCAITQWRGASVVASGAMVHGLDEWTMT